ncbi:flagellin lysine-N-methylase [Klebsiella quasivariicola]|uniref:flagellin lysine-N-methylase n=1 Tax=Klebsiella quasivariicola TaxID=2026240 RepID=UPI0018A28398|nr:flagellin lysine-N-methylase [Klebsiella quasivariicola]MBF7818285.1 flagellin lysine-N-methylase [Klebsiella quasivariicola]
MEEITILEPVFFKKFNCIGSLCPDHCCKGWDITLDESTVNRYMQTDIIEIRNIAVDNIITNTEISNGGGKIRLKDNGNCIFLDDENLCNIHKSLGEKALSNTCAIYPRLYESYKYEIRSNLTLSCPEAAKLMLTTPGAMQYSEKIKLSKQPLDAPDISQEDRLLNLMCTNIMINCGIDLDSGFYGIILLLITHDGLLDKNDPFENLLYCYEEILIAIQNGELRKMTEQLTPDYKLQSALLSRLTDFLSSKSEGRGWATLQHYYQNLIDLLNGNSGGDVINTIVALNSIWHDKAMLWFYDHSDLLVNYIQYRMYEDFFPLKNKREPFDNLYILMAECILLKWIVASSFERGNYFSEEDFIKIIYSYHSITRHDNFAEENFLKEIEKLNLKDKTSLVYLLR